MAVTKIKLQKNKLHQGDCVRLLEQLADASVDLIFADPPFNIGYSYDVYDDTQQAGDYLAWCREWIEGAHRALKSDGTFWLAIGDEYAAELKIASQEIGFHCRSWVIWYYTFGVNCKNGFSRSHTHLFHFVKDPKHFTFNRVNPQVRVKSARQLVYADNRANPNGRLPDNTWITRPQDAPESFSPNHDTWYFARVAGTFKEREGFHGCQMPEQLLARIIRVSSNPQELVVDPFGGSGTTLSVSKKLGRQWMGFELSEEYASYIEQRLKQTKVGDPIDGPADPIESAPSTAAGKRRKKPFDQKAEESVIAAYQNTADGYPADYLLCDQRLNTAFIKECTQQLGGDGTIWNSFLLQLRKLGKLPRSTNRPKQVTTAEMDSLGYASEVAWRLLSIDYRRTLDSILCSPAFAAEFDRLASLYGQDEGNSLDYRRVALSIRKRSNAARTAAQELHSDWRKDARKLDPIPLDAFDSTKHGIPGVFVLYTNGIGIYAGESENVGAKIDQLLGNPYWSALDPDAVSIIENNESHAAQYALKSAIVQREQTYLNCRLLTHGSELSKR